MKANFFGGFVFVFAESRLSRDRLTLLVLGRTLRGHGIILFWKKKAIWIER